MKESPLRVHSALFLVNVIYAASYTISKELMPYYIGPSGFILLRILGALLMMGTYHFVFVRERIQSVKDYLHIALCAVFGVALNMTMFFEGLSRTSPITASLIMVTTPILVVIIGFIAKEEKLSWIKAIGILIGTGSAAMLILSKGSSDKADSLLGDLYIFINAASYAIFLVIVRPLMKKYKPITVMFWSFLFGSIYVLPIGYAELSHAHWHELTPALWTAIAFTLICTTFIAYLLNSYALKHVASSVVGSYVYLQPVLGTMIAVGTGKYILHFEQAIYAILIFGGVYLVGKTEKVV